MIWIALILLSSLVPADAIAQDSAQQRYWCPSKGEIRGRPDPGCVPLVDKKDPSAPAAAVAKPEDFEAATRAFLQRYEEFLQCCATKPGPDNDLIALGAQANALLQQSQSAPPLVMFQSRMQAMVVPIARARDTLREIHAQWKDIEKTKRSMRQPFTGEAAQQIQRQLREQLAALERFAVRPSPGPPIAPTGPEIGDSTTNSLSQTGPRVGNSPFNDRTKSGTDIGEAPATLGELGGTPPGPDRNRERSLTTTQPVTAPATLDQLTAPDPDRTRQNPTTITEPVTTGDVGADIASPPGRQSTINDRARTGPAIGDSDINQQQ